MCTYHANYNDKKYYHETSRRQKYEANSTIADIHKLKKYSNSHKLKFFFFNIFNKNY